MVNKQLDILNQLFKILQHKFKTNHSMSNFLNFNVEINKKHAKVDKIVKIEDKNRLFKEFFRISMSMILVVIYQNGCKMKLKESKQNKLLATSSKKMTKKI